LFADDGWSEFDPENPYAEPSKDLVLGSDNNYYNEYDDLMLEPVIPATQDASEYAAEQEALRVAQAQADAKEAQEAQEKYIREQKEARDAVLAAQAKAKAEAEAKAKAAAAAASAAAAAQAAQAAQEYETGPVDAPNIFTSTPEPSTFSNYNDDYSNYTNSYFGGGFW
jgi:chemotaxis protein histidine kinase CheA